MAHEYDLRKIQAVLIEGFKADELYDLCFFTPELKSIELPDNVTKNALIRKIIDYVDRQRLHEILLTEIARINPNLYTEYKPYHNEQAPPPPPPPPKPINTRQINIPSTRPTIQSTREQNPFHYGGPVLPENFIGHGWAVDFCRGKLAARQRTNIAISGERRIGKTSLLHYIKKLGAEIEWGQNLCLFIECGFLSSPITATDFWQVMLDRLDEALAEDSPLKPDLHRLQEQQSLTPEDIRDFLSQHHKTYPRQTIILLLDEFELIFKHYNSDTEQLLTGLSSLTRDLVQAESIHLNLITATRDDLYEVCHPHTHITGLEFHSNFVPCQLDPFDRQETDYVVQTLLNRTTVTFSEEELEYIWQMGQLSDGRALPIFVQVAASLVFDYKQRYQQTIDFVHLKQNFDKQARLYRQDTPAVAPVSISTTVSTPVDDRRLDYEQGLNKLKLHIVTNHPKVLVDYHELAQQLRKNLDGEQQFGLNPTLQHDRDIVIEKLSTLSLQVLGVSFYKLATTQPTNVTKPSAKE